MTVYSYLNRIEGTDNGLHAFLRIVERGPGQDVYGLPLMAAVYDRMTRCRPQPSTRLLNVER